MDQTTEEMLADLDEAMTKYQNGKKLNLDSKDKRTSDLNKEIERIEALIGMYQKEYYLRKSLIEQGNLTAEGQDAYMSKEYYDKMHYAYEEQAKYYHRKIPWQKEETEMSAQSLLDQRLKLNPEIFVDLNTEYLKGFYDEYRDTDVKTYKGYILKALDGSDFEIPNTSKAKKEYGAVKSQIGETVPRTSVSMCYDLLNQYK